MDKTINDYSDLTILPEPILQSLQKRNLFCSGVASEPWFGTFPDVESINRQAFEEIFNLIKTKAASPRMPLAATILGEAGQGKTHLLRRISLACKHLENPALFVFVRPLLNSEHPLLHLLREIALSLAQKSGGNEHFSPLDRLVAEIMREGVRHCVKKYPTPKNEEFLAQLETDVFHILTRKITPRSMDIIESEAVNYIHSQVPDTTRELLRVILQYQHRDPEKQGLVIEWLKGNALDEEESKRLGVRSRQGDSDGKIEQEARQIILTLGILFQRYEMPMVVCFDQLDNLTRPELILGFGNMIYLLVDNAANVLPLAFIRGDSWNERFRKHLDKYVVDRLEQKKQNLIGCTREESKELVSLRIEQMFGQQTKESAVIIDWLWSRLESKLKGLNSPRQVIRHANQIIEGASSEMPTADEIMAAEYKKACGLVAADFDSWTPDSECLQRAAELFLTYQEQVVSCAPGIDRLTTWTGTLKSETDSDGEIPYACFINKSKHWQSVSAALGRCKDFLHEHPNGICTYVTDARCGFKPTWTATLERRREVEALGGSIVILDQSAGVRWYGLVSLSWKVGSGDVLLGAQSATEKDLENFLRTGFSVCKTEGLFDRLIEKGTPPPLPPAPPPTTTSDELIAAILDCLAQSVMPIMEIDRLMTKLSERGIIVTQERCFEQIGKNQHKIMLLPSRNSHCVMRTP